MTLPGEQWADGDCRRVSIGVRARGDGDLPGRILGCAECDDLMPLHTTRWPAECPVCGSDRTQVYTPLAGGGGP